MTYFENIKVEELFRNEEKYRNPPFSAYSVEIERLGRRN